jgi:hypothetical protein
MENQKAKNDAAWAEMQWNLGFGREQVSDTLWRCDALRAGRLYQRSLFATREEAQEFATRMQQVEPDQIFNVEAIKASTVWN